ncbi:helix-turn-helix domain-containing protein [Actinoallomurus iriomotensis]|uniref:Helix-turn-helix domain-containing protein n=1 Tax=Actinoallomurus iriomotensis TaxID=478107 RepID=A0A9W6VLK7_9ACTN|nr:hypothetical protein [Actinoallomurus iriomotensis]GLY72770.1 hypothetical protein Airi01_010370 [Actinoallomurus iriomotensis]
MGGGREVNDRDLPDDHLLKPYEAARALGIATGTLAQMARAGRLTSLTTPGGHRRYRWADIRALRDAKTDPELEWLEEEAARLYREGWTIREVAEKFDRGYGAMRRILLRRAPLRPPGARTERG